MVGCLCFFFKQKTAYELRISDWSSYVCSSDLPYPQAGAAGLSPGVEHSDWRAAVDPLLHVRGHPQPAPQSHQVRHGRGPRISAARADEAVDGAAVRRCGGVCTDRARLPLCGADAALLPHRSEEHTSELQSLMRISYAVFCLKKK